MQKSLHKCCLFWNIGPTRSCYILYSVYEWHTLVYNVMEHADILKNKTVCSEVISEINSVINHLEVSYLKVNTLYYLHTRRGCPKDCFGQLPLPHQILAIKLDLQNLVQELICALATENFPANFMVCKLAAGYNKLAKADELFNFLLHCFKAYARPRTFNKCLAKKVIRPVVV